MWSTKGMTTRRMPSPESASGVSKFALDFIDDDFKTQRERCSSVATSVKLFRKPEAALPTPQSCIDIDFILGDFVSQPPSNDTTSSAPEKSATESRKRRRVSPDDADEAVSLFLCSENAAWNHLVPFGEVASVDNVDRAGRCLGFTDHKTMFASLGGLPWKEVGNISDDSRRSCSRQSIESPVREGARDISTKGLCVDP
jgi:hypothetical protein